LDDRIDEFADIISEHYNIEEFGDPATTTDVRIPTVLTVPPLMMFAQEPVYVVGRITHDAESSAGGKLNEASLVLESSRMTGSGSRVPLRFDIPLVIRGAAQGAGAAGFFPGAMVALRGKNGGGGWFLASEILSVRIYFNFLYMACLNASLII
jgi:DNA polymerase alpha subunit B